MKQIVFTLILDFSEKISLQEDLEEVARKVISALKHECDAGDGLAPSVSEAYTTRIEAMSDTLDVYESVVLSD